MYKNKNLFTKLVVIMFRFAIYLGCCFATIAYGANIAKIPSSMRYMPYIDKNGAIQYEDLYAATPKPDIMIDTSQVKFRLHTQDSPLVPELIVRGNNFASLSNHSFNIKLPVVFTIHGWNGKIEEEVNVAVTASTLAKENANVFVVDWTVLAAVNYISASYIVDDVGVVLGDFVLYLRSRGVPPKNIKIIGFSLGAHVAGFAGKTIKSKTKLPTPFIVGLDPAGPFFTGIFVDSTERLDKTDADVVHVVHCNTATLGIDISIGHVDYFPNGGRSQVGCGLDLAGYCSHMRCPVLYAECIRKDYGCLSWKAKSYYDFKIGNVIGNPTPMGVLVNNKLSGNYYLNTNALPPYSLE